MSYPPKQKPPQWSIDSGVVAYNAARMGLPMPVGLWAMWEKGGDKVYDLSGNSYHSTDWQGATWEQNNLNLISSNNQYIRFGDILKHVGSRTIVAGIKLFTADTDGVILSKLASIDNNGDWMFWFDAVGAGANDIVGFFWNWGGFGNNAKVESNTIIVNEYYNVAAVLESGFDCKIYINGCDDTNYKTEETEALTGISSVNVVIGREESPARYFNGNIYYIYYFDLSLNPSQIANLSANPYALVQQPRRIWGYVAGETINLAASISAASNTSNAAMSVARALSAAVVASSTTPQCALNVDRDLIANIQAQSTTPNIVLANLIELVASIAVSSQTSALNLPVDRHLLASHSAGSQTSEIALLIARDLAASISAETVTNAIELVITSLINLAATINAISQTSQPQMAVARELSAQAQAQSTSSALILAVLRDLSGAVAAQTQTSDINLPVLRDISTSMAGQTSTSDAALNIIRAISAQISAGTDTSTAVLAVLREMQASMDASTLTSAINLIAGGMGVITDAIIESLTTERTLESFTPNREMDSLTVKRTIGQI